MEGSVESTSDEGEITNVFPTNTNWPSNNQNNPNSANSALLFIAVEYVGKEGAGDFKFETESTFSPQASTYSEFEQHVSPLDPNMSSAARYSPVYSDSVDTGYSNSVVVLQDSVNPLISSEICQNSEYVNTTNTTYSHLPSPQSPLDSISSPLSTSDNNLLRQVVANRYLQMVTTANGVEVDDASCGSSGSPVVDFNQRSPDDGQIIDKDLQLVPFPVDGYSGLTIERNLKVDPDQVELLITDQNTGVSYSGYISSQDFLVSRTPLPSLPEDESHLSQVLNTLGSHALVMEAQQDIHGVDPQGASLSMTEGQMLLQDPLLDSDLLLQAPVEIALDDTVLSTTSTLTIKNQNSGSLMQVNTNHTSNTMNHLSFNSHQAPEMVVCDSINGIYVKKEEMKEEIDDDFEAQQLRRSKRSRRGLEDDLQILNRVQTISDKPVPSRARATLPASYLVINKLPPLAPDTESEYGVFARKVIPKRTQFGPLEGILMDSVDDMEPFKLLVETETGAMHKLDISNENTSNWMRFVRPAKHYNELNLVLSQQGHSLYYTTTRAILPRQELQVGYSAAYAAKRKLQILQPNPEEENAWHCYECPSKFSSSEEFQKHLNIHDENKEEAIKPRIKKLGRFKRRNNMDCPFCTRSFLKRYSLNRHLLSHTNPSAFRDRQMRQIKRNFNKTDVIDKTLQWKCGICQLIFSNPSLHNIHELVHKNSNEETITGLPLDLGSGCHEGEFLIQSGAVQCPECSTEFSSHKELIEHVSEHGQKYSDDFPTNIKKAFKCIMCYKAFANRERLQRHMLVHGSEESKPLKCDFCNKRFLNNSALACHLKTHKSDKKMFECPICKMSFDQVLMLKEHVKSHSENGSYTCPHCSKIFKEYSIIRKHIRAFHCDRKHGCQYCGKPFPTLDKLRMHLLKHSDHREFLCADCGKQFKRKDKLKEHMKRMHGADREPKYPFPKPVKQSAPKKPFLPKVQPTDYHRFIYKCHTCLLGFKRRGMLVNHLAKRHPDISPESVPELNLPILKTTRDYYCQYCDKVYKSSSKRKAHILKNHPGADLPMSNRRKGGVPDIPGIPNPTFSQTVGSVTTNPHGCQWCHKQYASKAKLLQHQRKKHVEMLPVTEKMQKRTKIPKLPGSPAIPEDSKYGNSPDVPGDLGAVGSSGIIDEAEVTEDQLNALSSGGFIQCEDSKVVFESSGAKYKIQDEDINQQSLEEYVDCRGNGQQYYRIIQMQTDQVALNNEENVDDPPESSRLYRLLTANGPFPPYPPR